jgi:hypothetical protein
LNLEGKESGYDPARIGHDGISVGLWQFNLKANPQGSRSCAKNHACSTGLAMN